MGHQVVDYNSNRFASQSKYWRNYPVFSHSSYRRQLAALLLSLTVSACSITGPNPAGLESDAKLITSSVTKPAKPAGVASTDAEVIKIAVAEAELRKNVSTFLAWTNPATGSSGTIMAIDRFMGKHGQKCRGFKTTVKTFMGIAFYNGETCQISPSEWVLSWFRPSGTKS